MHVAELLVSQGASLSAKTFLEETPIGMLKKTNHPCRDFLTLKIKDLVTL